MGKGLLFLVGLAELGDSAEILDRKLRLTGESVLTRVLNGGLGEEVGSESSSLLEASGDPGQLVVVAPTDCTMF